MQNSNLIKVVKEAHEFIDKWLVQIIKWLGTRNVLPNWFKASMIKSRRQISGRIYADITA